MNELSAELTIKKHSSLEKMQFAKDHNAEIIWTDEDDEGGLNVVAVQPMSAGLEKYQVLSRAIAETTCYHVSAEEYAIIKTFPGTQETQYQSGNKMLRFMLSGGAFRVWCLAEDEVVY